MLKKYEITEIELQLLFEQMIHPEVYPFVRLKAESVEEYMFVVKRSVEAEQRGEMISRVIFNEINEPIGSIHLFDIKNHSGFLGTWIGKAHHGKGYNKLAKEHFLRELFYEKGITNVFMRIRCENIRSKRATEKLPYTSWANETQKEVFNELNHEKYMYDLYEVQRDVFINNFLNESVVADEEVVAH